MQDEFIIRARARAEFFGGISRSTLERWERVGKVPPPIQLSRRVVGWRRSTLEAFMQQKVSGGAA